MIKRRNLKKLYTSLLLASVSLFMGCATISPAPKVVIEPKSMASLQVQLNTYPQSSFKQVQAKFFTRQSKELVFRVLSDVAKTPQWLSPVASVEMVTMYNNRQFLLHTVLDSPWPFKQREIVSCVNTTFSETVISIKIESCSDRLPLDEKFVRLTQLKSSWNVRTISENLVEINYKTWLDPSGNVPAFIFNNELIGTSTTALKKLQQIIEKATLGDYDY
ncbi:MAG: hypothetical protein HRU25_17235 [Psychrobium sp.]|nr:hypothetical protein [Psychrobium sp.]